ncbi:hypothetical protein MMMB2_0863 [Mycobacterium marinum MB2]|nr:hypothetical protein MMMB2_0863 [Mycobacterium marinum MB2]
MGRPCGGRPIPARGSHRLRCRHRRAELRHGGPKVPQPASGRQAHPQRGHHHRNRGRAGARRHTAGRAGRDAAGITQRGPKRPWLLHESGRRARRYIPRGAADHCSRCFRAGTGI